MASAWEPERVDRVMGGATVSLELLVSGWSQNGWQGAYLGDVAWTWREYGRDSGGVRHVGGRQRRGVASLVHKRRPGVGAIRLTT